MKSTTEFKKFEELDFRAGTVIKAEIFPEARKPAYKLLVDFGPEIGPKKSSVQITQNYSVEEMVGMQVMGLVNLAPRQIGPFVSEVLVVGVADDKGNVVLVRPDRAVPNGGHLF